MKPKPQLNYDVIFKGSLTRAKKLQKEYRDRGYYTRVRQHNNNSYATLEIGEPRFYQRFPNG